MDKQTAPKMDSGLPDCLVEGCGDDEVLGGVELRAHDVVVVPRQHRDAVPALPVPDPDRLQGEGET